MILGIDPGLSGALALYDPATQRILSIDDMPTWQSIVGKKTRKRIDAVRLLQHFDYFKMAGIRLAVIEAVGGRPQQSASAGFVFGYTVGVVYMACVAVRLPITTTPSAVWKRIMKVPGKGSGDDRAIVARADELMPDDRELWRGQKGGLKIDRAEAAVIAKYGGDFLWKTYDGKGSVTGAEADIYKDVETGA